jgi:hypothetical protein
VQTAKFGRTGQHQAARVLIDEFDTLVAGTREEHAMASGVVRVTIPAAAFCTTCSALVAPPTTTGDPLELVI